MDREHPSSEWELLRMEMADATAQGAMEELEASTPASSHPKSSARRI